jgi:alpha-methylacyl-CoA racemase
VMNILLGLRQRDLTGEGSHIDVAMTDAMFTFTWHALAAGHVQGRFPGPGEARLCGGSPRYQLYLTADAKLVACAALEQKFWNAFTQTIGLAPKFVDDARDPQETKDAIAEIIRLKSAAEWSPLLARADCCATIVASLAEALQDRHFVERGLFTRRVRTEGDDEFPALPLPIAPQFRSKDLVEQLAKLDEDASLLAEGARQAARRE